MCKVFRISLSTLIDLHLKLLTRSDFTLRIVDRLTQSLFLLYCRIFFGEADVAKRERVENAKCLLKIATYFLGVGI